MIPHAIAAATALALAVGAQAIRQSAPASGAQQSGLVTATVLPPSQQDQMDPFDRGVLARRLLQSAVNDAAARATARGPIMPQWKVECGIKVMVVNPDVDPKMIITPSAGAPEPKIRRISPPPCSGGNSTFNVVTVKPSPKVETVKPSSR